MQELIAPRQVILLDRDWELIGYKCPLNGTDCVFHDPNGCDSHRRNALLSDITGIPADVMENFEARKLYSVEDKMRWAANRRTTEPEDLAYCLVRSLEAPSVQPLCANAFSTLVGHI